MSRAPKKRDPLVATLSPQQIQLDRKPQVVRVRLDQIHLHDAIPSDTLDALACISHKIGGALIFSEKAIEHFIKFHPILLTKTGKHAYYCFAGLRSYQLAKLYLRPDRPIDALLYQDIEGSAAGQLAVLDSYLTTLGFALDSDAWEIDTLRIWQNIGHEYIQQMTPELTTKISLAQKLNINRRRLSALHRPPESALKKELEQKASEHDQQP